MLFFDQELIFIIKINDSALPSEDFSEILYPHKTSPLKTIFSKAAPWVKTKIKNQATLKF